MSHKAGESFFESKKPWSIRKDRILGEYITAYLPKVATQKKPILIVDGFAGPGKFDDGTAGSPLILAKAIEKAQVRVGASLLCIERNAELFQRLRSNLSGFAFTDPRLGSFSENIELIEHAARSHSIFLYVDPFTVEGLAWQELDQVFQHLHKSRSSVEVLLNFNAASFARRGLAALQMTSTLDDSIDDGDEVDAPFVDPPSIATLNKILATDEWQDVMRGNEHFSTKVARLNQLVRDRLLQRFNFVCSHAMFAAPTHTTPKYYLDFASRHPDALILMNDAMTKSRESLAAMARPNEATLFETRSEELVPDLSKIDEAVLNLANDPTPRKLLMIEIVRHEFGKYRWSEIRGAIERLLKSGKLQSETGKWRINDDTKIWKSRK